jgi:hypothetical protein
MTSPEIRPFFELYVRDTRPLPLRELFAHVGVEYIPEVQTGEGCTGTAWLLSAWAT